MKFILNALLVLIAFLSYLFAMEGEQEDIRRSGSYISAAALIALGLVNFNMN